MIHWQPVRTQVNVVTEVKSSTVEAELLNSPSLSSTTTTTTTHGPNNSLNNAKGFTLKFAKASASDNAKQTSAHVVVAEKVIPKPKSNPDEPTGLVDQIFETRIEDGVTTVHETKIIGTYIGSQYARLLESTSTILPHITASRAPPTIPTPIQSISNHNNNNAQPQTPSSNPPFTSPPQTFTSAAPSPKISQAKTEQISSEKQEVHTEQSVVSSSNNNNNDNNNNNEFEGDEDHAHFNENLHLDEEPTLEASVTSTIIEPTPTASEEQTLYVLPQKEKKAEIYISPIPNANAYSRQPQLYVDISPAKSVDFIVTATPSRGKQFRQQNSRNEYLNRFNNGRNKTPPPTSTESNELGERQVPTLEVAASSEESVSAGRRNNRFRSRNRSGNNRQNNEDVLPTVSVYSNVVSATVTRRFNSNSRTRSKEVSYKTAAPGARGYSPATRQIQPTSSTSIYRFKLNRPTGRWRFKPSPKPKVNIIKTQDDDLASQGSQGQASKQQGEQTNGPVYLQNLESGDIQNVEETHTESNELAQDIEPELVPQTIRVATITPSEFSDLDKFLEIATIRSPYVFQAGNVKNTRYITLTKTFTREPIQPTQASVIADATFENLLATKPPYEKILEGSSDVATLPVIVLNGDMATPPLETVTQSFSTTQLMLKTSILPVLYDGVTTLYTLTQSYFITRLVTAHKTVPPMELFQFIPTKSLTEFNTALQEAGSEHREHLLASESENEENDANYEHILAPPDELTSVGSDFDPSSMDDKFPKLQGAQSIKNKGLIPRAKAEQTLVQPQPQQQSLQNGLPQGLPSELAGLSPEQLAFLRYFNVKQQQPTAPANYFQQQLLPGIPPLPANQPQYQVTSSPVVVDTITTIVETKTLRILFGAKPTQTTLFSTRVIPTKVTTYVTASVPVQPTAAISNFFNPQPFPLAYVG